MKTFCPLMICRILRYGTHQKVQLFQQVIRDRCSPVKSTYPITSLPANIQPLKLQKKYMIKFS